MSVLMPGRVLLSVTFASRPSVSAPGLALAQLMQFTSSVSSEMASGVGQISTATATAPAVHEPLIRWHAWDTWLAVWAGLAMVFGWGAWRGGRRLRTLVQVASVLIGGIWLGVMIGQGLFVGWARDGVPWRTAPALVLLTAAAAFAVHGANTMIIPLFYIPWDGSANAVHQVRDMRNTPQGNYITDYHAQAKLQNLGGVASGTFTTVDGKTATVTDGLITNLV